MSAAALVIDEILSSYRPDLGKEFGTYRNHVCRVYHNCRVIDPTPANEMKYALAAVFHDIGIWTDRTFDYIKPSIARARAYLGQSHPESDFAEIASMITWHHKLSPYAGEHALTTESFRKADWIDVTRGLLTFGYSRSEFVDAVGRYPLLGFHRFLLRQSIRNTLRHPLTPLPMFRW